MCVICVMFGTRFHSGAKCNQKRQLSEIDKIWKFEDREHFIPVLKLADYLNDKSTLHWLNQIPLLKFDRTRSLKSDWKARVFKNEKNKTSKTDYADLLLSGVNDPEHLGLFHGGVVYDGLGYIDEVINKVFQTGNMKLILLFIQQEFETKPKQIKFYKENKIAIVENYVPYQEIYSPAAKYRHLELFERLLTVVVDDTADIDLEAQ